MVKPWLKARGISGNKENRKGQKDFRRLPQAGCLGLERGEKSSLYDLNTTGGEKANAGWRSPACT